jgi:hypothetical protein
MEKIVLISAFLLISTPIIAIIMEKIVIRNLKKHSKKAR